MVPSPSPPSGKSAITFTQAALALASSSAASGRAAAVTSRASPGKYRPGGARKRPAVTTRGRPSSGPISRDARPGLPGSRTRSTPASRWARALAVTRSTSEAASPAGLKRARWAWASTRPGMRNPPSNTVSAPACSSKVRWPSTTNTSRSTSPGRTTPRRCVIGGVTSAPVRLRAGKALAVDVEVHPFVEEADEVLDLGDLGQRRIVEPGDVLGQLPARLHVPVRRLTLVGTAGKRGARAEQVNPHIDLGDVIASRQTRLEQEPGTGGLSHRLPFDHHPDVAGAVEDVDAGIRVPGMDEDLVVLFEPGIDPVPVE